MRFIEALFIGVLFFGSGTDAVSAQGVNPIVGVWKLLSYERKLLDTGVVEKTLGENTPGYLIYTAGNHYSAVMFGGERKKPAGDVPTAQEALTLFQTTIAGYAGSYRIEANKVIHRVDVAWTPSWIGTEQVRYFTIQGRNLTIETAPSRSALDGKNTIRYLKLERVE